LPDLKILRRTAASIAAAAIYETYPDIQLLGGGETPTGFSYDFFFPHPIHPHIIEEKMRQIVRERRPIRTLEMVPFSAAELLRAKGQHSRAEDIGNEELVEVIQIGTFHDLSRGPHLKNSFELAAFKIVAEPLSEKRMRICGWCHASKETLKQFLKQIENYVEPSELGKSFGLWDGDVWLKKGIEMREKLIQFLKKQFFQNAFEIAAPADLSRRRFGHPKVAEVVYSTPAKTEVRVNFFKINEEELISFLHLIGKTLTILGFDHSIPDVGSAASLVVEDGLGRPQTLISMERRGNDLQMVAHVESILEQMVEKNLIGSLENQ
jgi:hypothetical protein